MIDGEHYPPVVTWALSELSRKGRKIVAVVFLGGTEKITEKFQFSSFDYPVVSEENPLEAIARAIDKFKPDTVVDLSDEPVIGYRDRMRIASIVLSRGAVYEGSDFQFRPPGFHDVVKKPSMSIIGTGKRVGKTAVSAYACRELKKNKFNPGVVAMGRGGPAEPEVIRGDEIEINADFLLEQARAGRHAASDHFEDALMSRIPTVGCRRCGGGLAGEPVVSNVVAGAKIANDLDIDFIVFEGSGTAVPPVLTDLCVLVAGVDQPVDYIIGYLGTYRLLLSDLVVLTNCEQDFDGDKIDLICKGIREIKPGVDIVKTVFRPLPLESVAGENIFFTTTAPERATPILKNYFESELKANVVGISHHLSDRKRLAGDLDSCRGQFDVVVTELKAAAVDVVTEVGRGLGKRVVYSDNAPIETESGVSLSELLVGEARKSITRYEEKNIGKKAFAK